MEDVLIGAYGLWKKYSRDRASMMRYGAADALRAGLGFRRPDNLRKGEFWSLQDINIEVRRGQVLGLCGHNGAGKTTLLKTLTGLLQPDRGEVVMKGRISWLVDIGAGLNPVLTGRENALLRIDMLSMRHRGRELLDYVCTFSELDEFLDTPVGFYSSGMKAKLGFAIATMVTPDILIVDETLAVGDLGFRMKCYERISEISSQAAVLFVSHGMNHVARICTDGGYMEGGRMLHMGSVQETIRLYNEAMTGDRRPRSSSFNPSAVRIVTVNGVMAADGAIPVEKGGRLSVGIALERPIADRVARLHVIARDLSGAPVMGISGDRPAGVLELTCALDELALAPDVYDVSVMADADDGTHLAISDSVTLRVEGRFGALIAYQPRGQWTEGSHAS